MELKIWVEGIQRIVCGVTETTTCQDVVFALAHATGKIGRFTLIERWRNNERLLAPTDNPLKILMKWGEYSSDVQFILQRSEQQPTIPLNILNNQSNTNQQNQLTKIHQTPVPAAALQTQSAQQITPPKSNVQLQNKMKVRDKTNEENLDKIKDNIKKNGYCDNKEIGIVKGVQQQKPPSPINNPLSPPAASIQHDRNSSQTSSELNIINNNLNNNPNIPEYAYVTKKRPANNNNNNINNSNNSNNNNNSSEIEFNSADVRNSLDRKINLSNEILLDVVFNSRTNNLDTIKAPVGISANGALVPPPYRNPPPPRSSPLNYNSSSNNSNNNNNSNASNTSGSSDVSEFSDVLLNNAHYKDLIQLIKYQREKISLQQADLTKFDAEIVFLENKERDQMQQLEAIAREINKTDQMFRQGSEQLQTLQYIEEENELVRQQEKTLKSEITLLRSKLANCETELLQCKNKIRMLLDEIQLEQRVLNRQYDSRQQIERHFLTEVEKIQIEIDQAVQQADSTNRTSDNLKREVAIIESAIAEKKKQVEQLVNEMKEVNLKSLAVAPSEEIRHLLESSNRPGSTRRMIGSPRQLENAVPTSKNPHGVWV